MRWIALILIICLGGVGLIAALSRDNNGWINCSGFMAITAAILHVAEVVKRG